MSAGKQMTDADRDKVIKLAFGARKMSTTDVAKAFDDQFSEETIRRVIKSYKLVEEDNEQALIEGVAKNILSKKTVEWAYDYWAKDIPEDFYPRLDAIIKGEEYQKELPEQKDSVEGQNLLALLGKMNSIGTTLCECLTAEQAKIFTKAITECITANTDRLINELKTLLK